MTKPITLPKPPNPVGQAQLILRGAGLAMVKPQFFKIDENRLQTDQDAIDQARVEYSKSLFGTPIFDTIRFEAVEYVGDDGKDVKIGDKTIEIALFEINLPRNIVSTQITGRNGRVYEYMSNDDYNVTIRGSLVSDSPNVAPDHDLRHLNAFANAPVSLKVSCNVLGYFDIFTIIINSAKFSQREGTRNVWDYELSCVSELAFEIQTQNENNSSSGGAMF